MNILPATNIAIGFDDDGDVFVELVGACGCCRMRGLISADQAEQLIPGLRFQIDAARARKRGALAVKDGGRA